LFLRPDATPSQALRVITHHRVSITQPMPVSFAAKIRRTPGVRDSMVWQWFGGTYKDARDPGNFFARFAVEPDRFFNIKGEVQLPEDQKLAFQHLRTSCIVGKKLSERFQWKVGDHVAVAGDIFPVTLELSIAGIYSSPPEDDENLYFSYDYLRELVKAAGQSGRDEVGVFLTEVDRPEDVDAVTAAIDQQFEDSPAPTKSESEAAWQLSFVSFLGNLKLFLVSISGALIFTILLVSGNTISMAVRERVREVGILKTIGFTPQMILAMLMGESTLLALVGGFAGIALGAGLSAILRSALSAFGALRLGVTFDVAVSVVLTAAVIGLVSSFIPARSASRLSIVESLGDTG
jgi:putative ABC transport system permease protein